MKIINSVIAIIVLPFLLNACASVWHDPNTSVPSREIDITNILVTPTIYDGAGVEVEGKVWDLFMEHSQNSKYRETYTLFKLADKDGNYVNVRAHENLPVVNEGDIVKVTGIHRAIVDSETNRIQNQIEAYSIEK